MTHCQDEDAEAPRVGCGCRSCYHTRENALDPRLLAMVRVQPMSVRVSMSHEILRRYLIDYCAGRLDYGLLHVAIIKALVELADHQFEQTMELVSRLPPPNFIARREP